MSGELQLNESQRFYMVGKSGGGVVHSMRKFVGCRRKGVEIYTSITLGWPQAKGRRAIMIFTRALAENL